MKLPLSWIKDYVDVTISPEELAQRLTFAGLEVEQMEYIGLPRPAGSRSGGEKPELAWDPATLLVGQLLDVRPHPNADRLTLATVDIAHGEPIQVVTGAPNIKVGDSGQKVAFALEGARLYDGHEAGWKLITLKKSKIRGVESGCMVCSEKELAMSEDHEGIILLPEDAPVGVPLADYLGDIVFDIKINPNMARCASVVGIAREIAALTGQKLRPVPQKVTANGPDIQTLVDVVIRSPELNPRFTLALLRGTTIRPSPFWVQRRLKLAGMRPINNIVDVTNYVMLEAGQPLHAFDYNKLVARAGGKRPTLLTRLAEPGEELETLDGVKRKLDPFTILVCDERGALSIGGVMGGAESEVDDRSTDILLEAAAWEFINLRRTMASQRLSSEAGYRLSRGVHPAQAKVGLLRAIEMMRELGGGEVARGIIDRYPNQAKPIVVDLPVAEVERQLGVGLPAKEITRFLTALEFQVEPVPAAAEDDQAARASAGPALRVTVPDHRLDVDGTDDLIEEIARMYGYDRIPISRMNDELPPQMTNVDLDQEEWVRDHLVDLGLQDVVTYSFTTPEREAMLALDGRPISDRPYVRVENPISAEYAVLRQTLLPNLLKLVGANLRYRSRVAAFELGSVFLTRRPGEALLPREQATELPEDAGQALPLERRRLGIVLTGPREEPGWQKADTAPVDFFDLKGVVEALLDGLHLKAVFAPATDPVYQPGQAAVLKVGEQAIGVFGALHPLLHDRFDLPAAPVLMGEFDLDALLSHVSAGHKMAALSRYPAVTQDLALIVDKQIPAEQVRAMVVQTGGSLLQQATLFDVYEGDPIPADKKSLAFSLAFQAPDRTLSDADASKLREKIVARLRRELGAELRS